MTREPIRLSTAIMAHPYRSESALRLQKHHPDLRAQIVLDPVPDGPAATLRTARLAWAATDERYSHHLVLQDDVVLCDGFSELVIRAAGESPGDPLVFFTHWSSLTAQMVRVSALAGATWTPVLEFTPTQAVLLPSKLAREFAEYTKDLNPLVPDNSALTDFLALHGLTPLVSTPNLVDHASVNSLLGHDVMFGIRSSVLFPRSGDCIEFNQKVAAPLAAIPVFRGITEVYSTSSSNSSLYKSSSANELLGRAGMTNAEIIGEFWRDLRVNPSAEPANLGLGHTFTFQVWQTIFILGIMVSSMLGETAPEALDKALERPWAREALATFPAGTLSQIAPEETLSEIAGRLLPLCVTGLRSGFVAASKWPRLAFLGTEQARET